MREIRYTETEEAVVSEGTESGVMLSEAKESWQPKWQGTDFLLELLGGRVALSTP